MASLRQEIQKEWKNWSGTVTCTPLQTFYPKSIEEVVLLVRRTKNAGKYLRIVGSGQSFSSLVHTDQVLLSLEELAGIEQLDTEQGTITVYGGTIIQEILTEAASVGYTLENVGTMHEQSIAGAISTGAHGTGIKYGALATQVLAFTIVTAEGKLLECSPSYNTEVFKAAQLSLGLIGVIVKATMRITPLYPLREHRYTIGFDELPAQYEPLAKKHRHVSLYWHPYTDTVQVRTLDRTEEHLATEEEPLDTDEEHPVRNKGSFERLALRLFSWIIRFYPQLTKHISRWYAHIATSVETVTYCEGEAFYAPVIVYNEMEYYLPIEHIPAVMMAIRDTIEQGQLPVHLPIAIRFVQEDDIWLSPAYERTSAAIAISIGKGMPYENVFKAIEAIFHQYGGRPHWGKIHTLTPEQVRVMYPKWDAFVHLRTLFDPYETLGNSYVNKYFIAERANTLIDPQDAKQMAEAMRALKADEHSSG